MQQEHDAKLEEFRLAEEEKNQELERLRNMSQDLEDQKNKLETQLNEMSSQYTNDVRLLKDLSQVKQYVKKRREREEEDSKEKATRNWKDCARRAKSSR